MSRLKRWLGALICLAVLALGGIGSAQACTTGACVTAGPRLASVNSSNGALLNLLLGNLTGSSLSLGVGDWNSIASGDVSLAKTLGALQTSLGVSTPATALTTNASLAQIVAAAATAATGESKTSLALALNNLQVPLQGLGGSIRLGDLLFTDGALANTRINALELASGAIQLYNARNVLTTPSPITVSGSSLGIPGLASGVTLSAQVVEPPVYVCGPVGSSFHTASVRVKLGIDLVSINLDATLLKAIPLVGTASAQVGRLDLYLELAHAAGIITSVNAITNAFSVQATPGVASLYLGSMSDTVFFNRTHTINAAADLSWSSIGSVTINSISVGIFAKASAVGGAASASNLNFAGPYPQGYTVSSGAAFVSSLLTSLSSNLQISLGSGLGSLQSAVAVVLQPLVQLAVGTVLDPLVSGLIDPLLELLGIGLGKAEINAGGTILACSISGTVYEDANHTGRMEAGEAGTGETLYAKLVPSSSPAGPATAVATVDPASGSYSFSGVTGSTSYLVIINGTAAASQVTPAAPSGWLPTETPTSSLGTVLAASDISGQRFGLYHGSRLGGTVFKDNGSGGGTANNGTQDGSESARVGAAVKVTNAAGTTVYDSTTSGTSGSYALWIPSTAGAAPLKVVHSTAAEWIAVSGNAGTTAGVFTQADATVTFTPASGSSYGGVNFGDVPANRFEPDGQQQVLPGAVAYFSHGFTAGSAGQLGFNAAGGGGAGWTSLLYLDANCNGQVDAGELPISATIAVAADQKLCVVAKVASPANAPYNAQYAVALTAHFVYANASLASDHVRNDLVTVGNANESGLRLLKTVDKAAAATGDLITYTITYVNRSDAPLTTMKIVDATPAYTVFSAAACGSAPNTSISCTLGSMPAAGLGGRLEWTFSGSLTPGASGSVSFSVVLQ